MAFSENEKRGIAGLLEQHRAKLLAGLNKETTGRKQAEYLACLAEFDERAPDIARRLDLPYAAVVVHLPGGKHARGAPAVQKAPRPPSESPVKLRLVTTEAHS